MFESREMYFWETVPNFCERFVTPPQKTTLYDNARTSVGSGLLMLLLDFGDFLSPSSLPPSKLQEIFNFLFFTFPSFN